MKVLMVLEREFPPDLRVENEIEALIDADFEVHIACYTKENRPDYELLQSTHIHRKKIAGFTHKTSVGCLKFPFYFNFWRSFIFKLFKEFDFDIIHIHDLPLAQIGFEMKTKFGVSFVLDLHENWPAYLRMADHTNSIFGKLLSSNNQWVKYETSQCSNADNIIVVVKEAKDRLIKAGISSDKIVVVSNTLNINHFNIPKEVPDKNYFTLTYAGGINKHRGLQFVIKSLTYLKDSPKKVKLVILGEGSYLESLKELCVDEGVKEMVRFPGWVQYKEMQKYVGMSDVCLIPHEKNDHTDSTIPHKLFQYMYAGKPVLASNCSPIKRIIAECKCGLIYKFDDVESIASQVSLLMTNSELYENMAINGRLSVEKEYNWEHDKKQLLSIYTKK